MKIQSQIKKETGKIIPKQKRIIWWGKTPKKWNIYTIFIIILFTLLSRGGWWLVFPSIGGKVSIFLCFPGGRVFKDGKSTNKKAKTDEARFLARIFVWTAAAACQPACAEWWEYDLWQNGTIYASSWGCVCVCVLFPALHRGKTSFLRMCECAVGRKGSGDSV